MDMIAGHGHRPKSGRNYEMTKIIKAQDGVSFENASYTFDVALSKTYDDMFLISSSDGRLVAYVKCVWDALQLLKKWFWDLDATELWCEAFDALYVLKYGSTDNSLVINDFDFE